MSLDMTPPLPEGEAEAQRGREPGEGIALAG
jgi:hypothetical protein